MLERPAITDQAIVARLREAYGLQMIEVTFLPIGNDRNTAVFRAVTTENAPYFLKLRSGSFDTITVDLPKLMADQGLSQIIALVATVSGDLSAQLGDFHTLLYPFIEGQGGWDQPLSDADWIEFGRALKGVHSLTLPDDLAARIPKENYTPKWRDQARAFLQMARTKPFTEPSAVGLVNLLQDKQAEINHLLQRAEELCAVLQTQPASFILCHSDIHVGNVLLNKDKLYIVDWDQPILAPKERDLMFIGGGLGGGGHTPEQEIALFYQGYGQTEINPVALAYYRYERIVQDIVAYCEQLLTTDEGGEDRREGLRQITGQFQPGAVVDLAYRAERSLPPELAKQFGDGNTQA